MKLHHYFIGGLFFLALNQRPAISMTEQEMGKAIGFSAIVDCLIRTGKEPEKERDPMTKPHMTTRQHPTVRSFGTKLCVFVRERVLCVCCVCVGVSVVCGCVCVYEM